MYTFDDPVQALLRIYVFDYEDNSPGTDEDDWLAASGLGALLGLPATGNDFDDRGYLVYNYDETAYAQWVPGDVRPEDGELAWDWDDYWGVYAGGGFNNTAWEAGLDNAEDFDNELYEVVYKGELAAVRRSIKDPDDDASDSDLVDYWDGTVSPEPSTALLLACGLAGLAAQTPDGRPRQLRRSQGSRICLHRSWSLPGDDRGTPHEYQRKTHFCVARRASYPLG